jgi:hypothetical protein
LTREQPPFWSLFHPGPNRRESRASAAAEAAQSLRFCTFFGRGRWIVPREAVPFENAKARESEMSDHPVSQHSNQGNQPKAFATPMDAIMHPHVYRLALVCWLCFLAVFWVTFWTSSNALFQVVIGTVYAAMFFGVPYEMSRIYPGDRMKGRSFLGFMSRPFQASTGSMHGYEAVLQVIMVPMLLTLGGTAIGIIIRLAKAGAY